MYFDQLITDFISERFVIVEQNPYQKKHSSYNQSLF